MQFIAAEHRYDPAKPQSGMTRPRRNGHMARRNDGEESSTTGRSDPTKRERKTVSKPEVIKIDDVEYVRRDSSTDGEIKIAVLDRGFVYIGQVDMTDPNMLILRNAKNIRVWGTSKGLGELVNGPLSGTKLDAVGTVRAPFRALISLIDVEQAKWKLI